MSAKRRTCARSCGTRSSASWSISQDAHTTRRWCAPPSSRWRLLWRVPGHPWTETSAEISASSLTRRPRHASPRCWRNSTRPAGLLGLDRAGAWEVVRRVGMDSVPKLRRAVLDHLATCQVAATTTDVAEAVEHPRQTTRRSLEDLAAHQVVIRTPGGPGKADRWALSTQTRHWLDATVPALSEDTDGGVTVPALSEETHTDGDVTVPGLSEEKRHSRADTSLNNVERMLDDITGKVTHPADGHGDEDAHPATTSDGKPFVFDPTTAFSAPLNEDEAHPDLEVDRTTARVSGSTRP